MEKNEVIAKFCELSGQVAAGVFGWAHAADCFCGTYELTKGSYQYEDAVLNCIREAVHERMKREGHTIPTV